ncbi:hypothetical protein NCC78_16730 [Micromonospora phytophila]|uniref:hypothetical protein n=1 Tax=Micromonospora phytophila TaxID=709888 RepID=UPI00202DBC28|nr:hypothetical protein [Micromonospora phytophila]MCM0676320.1 hypothetical protein [Micromonospora phytophila]
MSDDDRPSTAALTSRLRLHRREWRHDGRSYQVISLRAADRTRYAARTERHWTVVSSDLAGARLLGRLLWGLSYQRRPDTLLVLEPGRMLPDPDHGRPSPTVVFAVADRTVLTPATARRLRRPELWRTRPSGTVSWNTMGFPGAMRALHAAQDARRDRVPLADTYEPTPRPAHVTVTSDVVTALAVPQRLRDWAIWAGNAGGYWYGDESCTELDWAATLDVHAVRHFHRLSATAARARAEVLAVPGCPAEPELIDQRVRAHIDVVAARRPGPWDFEPPVRPD